VWTGTCCSYGSTSYSCHPTPPSCGGSLSCACASTLCSCACQGATGNELDCVCLGDGPTAETPFFR
jgi:hypothetical protein